LFFLEEVVQGFVLVSH